jgi:hypothetical protein
MCFLMEIFLLVEFIENKSWSLETYGVINQFLSNYFHGYDFRIYIFVVHGGSVG